MFMEDDFTTCEGSLAVLYNAVNKLNANSFSHNWLALRVSYGMNGILMRRCGPSQVPRGWLGTSSPDTVPRSVDTLKYMRYLEQHVARKPVDLLWQEFVMPTQSRRQDALQGTDGREMFVYKCGFISLFPRTEGPNLTTRPTTVLWQQVEPLCSCWICVKLSCPPLPQAVASMHGTNELCMEPSG